MSAIPLIRVDVENVESRQLKVQVCVLTLGRPELLKLALDSLLGQTVHSSTVLRKARKKIKFSGIDMQILVVDNDIEGSGRPIFDDVLGSDGTHARYVCEPKKGFSSARNRALIESTQMEMDYIAFLDDDEIADSGWLAALLEASIHYDVEVVTGPVDPRHIRSPQWVVDGGFFLPIPHKTGEDLTCAATNNVLLSRLVFTNFRFDSRFDITGGEDTEFFMRVRKVGHRIIWCNEAHVSECVPVSRATWRWIVNRARIEASRYTRSCLSQDSSAKTILSRLLRACAGFLAGLILLPRSILGRHHGVRALQLMSRSVGTVTAIHGRKHVYYESIHG